MEPDLPKLAASPHLDILCAYKKKKMKDLLNITSKINFTCIVRFVLIGK